MAFQRIRIKNSNVIGKIPGADKLDTAELCINLKDHKLFSKDADGNVFELGKTAVNNGPTPPSNGNEIGDLWWDGDNLLVWNGSSWEIVGAVTSVNGEVGDVVLELGDLDDVAVDGVVDEQVLVYDANQGKWVPASAASLAVDVDLGYTAAPAKGTVTNTAGDDAELPLVNATNAGLMSPADFEKLEDVTEIGDGTLTIKDPNGDALGTFTANQVDDSEITIPATKWEEIEGNPITIGGPQPNNPSPGDIWIDTGDCPPTINIWDDCDDPGNPTWTPIGGGGGGGCVQGPVQITSSNGTELNSTLTAVGGNGVDDSTTLTATYEWTGAKTGTGSSIVADVEGNYTVTASITCVDGSVLRNSAVWTVSDSYVDMVNNTPPVIAVVGGGVDEAYEGNSIYVVTNATVLNGEIPSIVETQWFKDGVADGTGSIYTIGAGDEGAVITAQQLFRDLRSNELLSLASNEITIVERPADAITFTAVITDDGTPTGNTPGHVLTASATNIVGGTSPIEYAYQWKSGGVATVTTKTYTLVEGDVGKIITCDVTVAEPDGTNPETRTATYAEVIEIAGTINKPTVLAPEDGAGSGVDRPIVTNEIIAVDNTAGSYTCETDLITSVTPKPNTFTFIEEEGGSFASTDDYQKLFDGQRNTEAETTINKPSGGNDKLLGRIEFDPPIQFKDTVTIYQSGTNLARGYYFNGLSSTEKLGPYNTDLTWTKTELGVDEITSLNIIGRMTTGNSYRLSRLTVDGEHYVGTAISTTVGTAEPTSGTGLTELTLSGPKDLDCFERGDVVQSGTNIVRNFADPSNFSGDPPNSTEYDSYWGMFTPGDYSGGANKTRTGFYYDDGKSLTYTFNPPIPVAFSMKMKSTKNTNGSIKINGSEVPSTNATTALEYFDLSGNLLKTLEIAVASNTGAAIYEIFVDDKQLLNSDYPSPDIVKIIDIPDPQTDPPTLVVDGGDWDPAGVTGDDKVKGKTTSWDTTLELAGAKDLDVLQVGDTVKMGMDADVPYQPVSDLIESVETRNSTVWTDNPSGFNSSYPPENLIDGDNSTICAAATGNASDNEYSIYVDVRDILGSSYSGPIYSDYVSPTASVPSSYNWKVIFNDDSESAIVSGDGTHFQPIYTPNGKSVKYIVTSADAGRTPGGLTGCYSTTPNEAGYITGVQIQDPLTLTLSGDTDLAYFRPGDVVQGGSNNELVTQNFTTTDGIVRVTEPIPNAYNGQQRAGVLDDWFMTTTTSNNEYFYMGEPGVDLGIPCSKISFWWGRDSLSGTGVNIYINEGDPQMDNYNSGIVNFPQWDNPSGQGWTHYNVTKGVINNLKIQVGNVYSKYFGFAGIMIDDVEVLVYPDVKIISISEEGDANHPSITVDDGDWYADPANGGDGSGDAAGDTEVTCVSPLKAPTDWKVERIHEDDNKLDLSHATPDNNAQVWVANDNQAGTDFYVIADRTIVDDPLLTADVELKSSLFATTPPGVDTLNNIVWELNGVEQNAGTSNPYKPTLAINTTYTVRVKHQGNALEDSPWSDQTTFTTGATRNIYTYYKERVELLEARLAGIEADEIVDDATDVTLLTAFANLVERVEALENP